MNNSIKLTNDYIYLPKDISDELDRVYQKVDAIVRKERPGSKATLKIEVIDVRED